MELQENPPQPLDDLVFIEERPEMMVVVKRFGGFSDYEQFNAEAAQLYLLALTEGLYVVPPSLDVWL